MHHCVFLFQFPWITLCSNEPIPQENAVENIKFIIKFGKTVSKFRQVISTDQNITESETKMLMQWFNSKEARFANFPHKMRHTFGHKLHDIIIDCKFSHVDCTNTTFKLLQSPKFYNCYTYRNTLKSTNFVGIEKGLSLILKGQDVSMHLNYNQMSNSDDSRGIRITIHEPNTIPNLADDGIDLVPGHSTSVSLVQKNIERLSTPTSRCTPEQWIKNKIPGNPDFKGTFYTCIHRCLSRNIYKFCACVPEIIPDIIPKNEINSDYIYCLYTNESDPDHIQKTIRQTQCHARHAKMFDQPCFEDCKWNCNEISYITHITQSQWPLESNTVDFLEKYVATQQDSPSKLYLDILRYMYNGTLYAHYNKDKIAFFGDGTEVSQKFNSDTSDAVDKVTEYAMSLRNKTILPSIKQDLLNLSSIREAEIKWVQDSFYRLNIYFKDPVVEVHKQVLNYSVADLAAGMGGILGLWGGVSVITVIEFMEFMGNLINGVYGNLKDRKSKVTVISPE